MDTAAVYAGEVINNSSINENGQDKVQLGLYIPVRAYVGQRQWKLGFDLTITDLSELSSAGILILQTSTFAAHLQPRNEARVSPRTHR